jgi:hypothetical protein
LTNKRHDYLRFYLVLLTEDASGMVPHLETTEQG